MAAVNVHMSTGSPASALGSLLAGQQFLSASAAAPPMPMSKARLPSSMPAAEAPWKRARTSSAVAVASPDVKVPGPPFKSPVPKAMPMQSQPVAEVTSQSFNGSKQHEMAPVSPVKALDVAPLSPLGPEDMEATPDEKKKAKEASTDHVIASPSDTASPAAAPEAAEVLTEAPPKRPRKALPQPPAAPPSAASSATPRSQLPLPPPRLPSNSKLPLPPPVVADVYPSPCTASAPSRDLPLSSDEAPRRLPPPPGQPWTSRARLPQPGGVNGGSSGGHAPSNGTEPSPPGSAPRLPLPSTRMPAVEATPAALLSRVEKGEKLIRKASREEQKGLLPEAYESYRKGLRYVLDVLPQLAERDPLAEDLRHRIGGYLQRAEQLKENVDRLGAAAK